MRKTLFAATVAVAIVSLGTLIAQAGNGAHGISKYQTSGQHYAGTAQHTYPITEFSSSSAKTSPKR